MTNLFFYQCESCVDLCLKFLCGLSGLSGKKCINQNIGILADYSRPQSASNQTQATSDELNMSNEPNLDKTKNEQITHLINEQRTTNYEQLSNEPNLQKTINEQFTNEPNLKNTKKTVTNVPGKDYMKNDTFAPRKMGHHEKRCSIYAPTLSLQDFIETSFTMLQLGCC